MKNKLFIGAIVGTALTALCCFTPVLVILFSVAGLSALTGYLDYILLPMLVFFIALSIYALWRDKKCKQI